MRLKQVSEFICHGCHDPTGLLNEKLHCRSEGCSIANFEAVDQTLEAPSGRFASRRLPVFKKCGDCGAYLRFR